MNTIERAADEYIGHPREIDEGSSIYMARIAFKDGACWQKNHSWHSANEIPEPNVSGLIVMYKDSTLGFINMDDVNDKLGLHIVSDGWAYLKDILPTKELN